MLIASSVVTGGQTDRGYMMKLTVTFLQLLVANAPELRVIFSMTDFMALRLPRFYFHTWTHKTLLTDLLNSVDCVCGLGNTASLVLLELHHFHCASESHVLGRKRRAQRW
jgi:hypothetical protein